MKLVVSPQADRDLEGIADYIAQYSLTAAERLLVRFRARWNLLPAHPLSGPPRDDIAPGLRHLVIGDYLALYRVTDDAIEILRVLHGKRDLSRTGIGDPQEDQT